MFDRLVKHKIKEPFQCEIDFSNLAEFHAKIEDEGYFTFILEISNGGFFFDKALHIYGLCKEPCYQSILDINDHIQNEYRELVKGTVFFGQDIFGNQFGYDKNEIVFFNIETAEKKVIAKNFEDWIAIILRESNYYTGHPLAKLWGNINFNERLCPKKPFIIGGEYKIENLYIEKYPMYLSTNANIARQIFYLPDGTDIIIKTIE